MKIGLLFLLLFATGFTPSDQVIEWVSETEHDFGDLLQAEPATFHFQFKNISDQPIVIDNVRPQCGCTAPDWDETPIEPDSIGTIQITYDARKTGYFRKKVKVFFSGQRKGEKLYVEGFVEEN